MIKVTQVQRGIAISHNDQVYLVVEYEHIAKGNKRSYMQVQLRNIDTGQIITERFRAVDTVEQVFLDKKAMEYLYSSGSEHVLMDMENYNQINLSEELIGERLKFLKPNTPVTVLFCQGRMVDIELPHNVELEVKDTPPGIKGATATNQMKEATLETGLRIKVPPFIEIGEIVRVDTRSGEYMERVKKG